MPEAVGSIINFLQLLRIVSALKKADTALVAIAQTVATMLIMRMQDRMLSMLHWNGILQLLCQKFRIAQPTTVRAKQQRVILWVNIQRGVNAREQSV